MNYRTGPMSETTIQEGKLDEEKIEKCLSKLGREPNGVRFVYTKLDISVRFFIDN